MCSFCYPAFIPIILMVVLSHSCSSTATQNPPENSHAKGAIQASEAVKIQRAWDEDVERLHEKLRASSEQNKGSVREEFEILENLLNSASAGVADSELDRIVHSAKPYEEMSTYEQTFLQLHIANYADEGSLEKLVDIISIKCPRNVGYVSIELGVTNGKKPENLIVFFEAYAKASDEHTKQQLLSILKSVFADLQKQYRNEAEFLAASKQWLLANQSKVKINRSYSPSSFDLQRRRFFIT